MSSTDRAKAAAVRTFFDRELAPLAQRLKDSGRMMFPTGADPSAPTYFNTRSRTTMAREDFILAGLDSPSAFARVMKQHWAGSGFPEMAALAPSMGRLAEMLRGEPEKDEEVSPFIYVMF